MQGVALAPGIKAIETHYRGYRFRSRTEARWAVFFDEMRLLWTYEQQGYDIEGVGRYLPDFEIGQTFVEIKPLSVADDLHAWTALQVKLRRLTQATKRPTFLLIGLPDGYCAIYYQFDPATELPPTREVELVECRECGALALACWLVENRNEGERRGDVFSVVVRGSD
jgi:hypothetical protein